MVNRHAQSLFLGTDAPIPIDRPFTTEMAFAAGVSRRRLQRWLAAGLVVHPLRGVFCAAQVRHDLAFRIECLRLVVPSECVVTDRTAAWLWGATTALAPNDHLLTPRVHVFCPPGHRLRNGLVASGERMLGHTDVVERGGIRVTTPLRTACDLGRLLHRDQAFAAMDALAALEVFSTLELSAAVRRFAGYRGVIQLRTLAPFVDHRSQSPGESILRLRWLDVGLPGPELQIEVPAPGGGSYFLDLGLSDLRFAAEYDGARFHDDEHRKHDEDRRQWISSTGRWTIVVARNKHITGRDQEIFGMLTNGIRDARVEFGRR